MTSSPQNIQIAKQVTARRGSTSAADPYGRNAHLNENPSRASASILTIVRVPQSAPGALSANNLPLQDPPRRFGSHRRIGSNPNAASNIQSNQIDSPTRISFASASFGGPPQLSSSHPVSPSSSPRLRPASPRLTATPLHPGKPRLTPDQLVDLARQSTDPRFLNQQQSQAHCATSSPIGNPYSPSGLRPGSPSLHSSVAAPPAPATFTPLPDDIYLPFIDRPSEVLTLISTPPSLKLFQLLSQTFPKPDTSLPIDPENLPSDSTKWGYPQLYVWLTKLDRDVAPDPLWVMIARKCVVTHSELIWERIKGALGVPPELDLDLDDFEGYSSGASSLNTDEISDDEGRKARGHWEDWDAIIDSPVFDREQGMGGSPVTSRRHTMEFATRVPINYASDGQEPEGDATVSPTPAMGDSPPTISQDLPSPELDADVLALTTIFIEPLLASSITSSAHPSAGDPSGLGDIAEGTEEEEADMDTNKDEPTSSSTRQQDPNFIHPSQIQGLKIATHALTSSSAAAAVSIGSPVLGPSSPGTPYSGSVTISRSPSIGSIGSLRAGLLRRSDSFGSVMSSATGWRSGSPVMPDDGPYDPVADRASGNPLFPSNFARLALGPTLVANNPSLRHPAHPPLSRYIPQHGPSSPAPSVIFSPSLYMRQPKTRTYSHGAASVGYRDVGKGITTPAEGTLEKCSGETSPPIAFDGEGPL